MIGACNRNTLWGGKVRRNSLKEVMLKFNSEKLHNHQRSWGEMRKNLCSKQRDQYSKKAEGETKSQTWRT